MPVADEQPWLPVDNDPNTILLLNPQGTRHLSFDQRAGTWWRLRQHGRPEPLGADRAAMLRPSDIDAIIKLSTIWIMRNPTHPRAGALTDEMAHGAKALVLHFAQRAGVR